VLCTAHTNKQQIFQVKSQHQLPVHNMFCSKTDSSHSVMLSE